MDKVKLDGATNEEYYQSNERKSDYLDNE